MRRKRRAYELAKAQTFPCQVLENPGLAVKRFKPKHARQPTQVPIQKWTEHIQSYFWGGQGVTPLPAEPDRLGLAGKERWILIALTRRHQIQYEVKQALRSIKDYDSPGEDGVGAAFQVCHSRDRRGTGGKSSGAPAYACTCSTVRGCAQVGKGPCPWKVAKLTPIFKEGDPTQASNYRMIAVSSVLYCLFASVANSLLTKWCMREKVLPKEQFGFVPGRNCQQAQFIERHLAQMRKRAGRGQDKRL
jgi:hypothetical protein